VPCLAGVASLETEEKGQHIKGGVGFEVEQHKEEPRFGGLQYSSLAPASPSLSISFLHSNVVYRLFKYGDEIRKFLVGEAC